MTVLGLICTAGLLLLKSDPAGARIEIDGMTYGETPRLITTLDAETDHRVTLRKAGYAPSAFRVHFDGRHPLCRMETLLLDSGILEVITEPVGAEVTVNGVVRGTAPLTVREVPKGMATVKLTCAGFRPAVRELKFQAGERQTLAVTLEGIPGTLTLRSVPSGARFYVQDEARGVGPLVLAGLPPGSYKVRCELEGYTPEERVVELKNGASPVEEFNLTGVTGTLEVRTAPAGALVYVDDHLYGTTKSEGTDVEFSAVLSIPGLVAGEHTLRVKKEGYKEVVRHPQIKEKKVSKHHAVRLARAFTPDVEIVTTTGAQRGILVRKTDEHITLEVKLGVERSYPLSDVKEIRYLEK